MGLKFVTISWEPYLSKIMSDVKAAENFKFLTFEYFLWICFQQSSLKGIVKICFFFCMNAYPMEVSFSLIYCRTQWSIETKSIETLAWGTLNWVNFFDFANRWNKLWGFEEYSKNVGGIDSIGSCGSIYVSNCFLHQLLLILQPRRGL